MQNFSPKYAEYFKLFADFQSKIKNEFLNPNLHNIALAIESVFKQIKSNEYLLNDLAKSGEDALENHELPKLFDLVKSILSMLAEILVTKRLFIAYPKAPKELAGKMNSEMTIINIHVSRIS